MKAAIIGGGIGGLTTAIALQQVGIDFEIFEAAPELKPVGAGIVMASNAMQVFQRLGIENKIRAAGFEIHNACVVDQSFKTISEISVKEKITPRYGIGSYAIHRGRLQQILLNEIESDKINLNRRLASLIQQPNRIEIKFEDGSTSEADIVIGADGIKSAVRKSIFDEIPLRYSGQTCWRGIANFSLPPGMKQNSYEMWGKQKGARFGFVPSGPDEVYYFTTYFAAANIKDEPGRVKKKLVSLYSDFGTLATQLIETTAEDNIIRSDIHDFAPLKQWWKGRIVLIGDAAHATTPNLGQGGCQAVEDAYVLAKCLKEYPLHEKAFEEFQRVRYQKAVYVVNTSRTLGKMTNIENPILQFIRNGFMYYIPESVAIKQLDRILKLDY